MQACSIESILNEVVIQRRFVLEVLTLLAATQFI